MDLELKTLTVLTIGIIVTMVRTVIAYTVLSSFGAL